MKKYINFNLIVILTISWSSLFSVEDKKVRPNIVVLVADDWGFSDVGSFGGEISTPHLDELAKKGVRFSNFHVTASCSPTRSMLMTGVDNHLNGVGNMRETIPREHIGKNGYLSVLNQNVVTVASLLKDSGYRTYVAGKWHVGHEAHNLPPNRGFDRSLIQADSGSDNWETAKKYLDLTEKVNWYEDGKEAVMPPEYYSSQFYIDKTIEYIQSEEGKGKPFFSYIGFQANHLPVQAPREFIDHNIGRYTEGWTELRKKRRDRAVELGIIPDTTQLNTMPTTPNWSDLKEEDKKLLIRNMEVYAGMAEAMDYHVGRLISHLKKTGQFDNTIFIFLSDNGSESSDPYAVLTGKIWLWFNYSRDIDRLGEKGTYGVIGPGWATAAASPLNMYKFYSGEGGVRVPLIISGAKFLQNQIHHSFAFVKDIVPTILDIANVSHPGTSYNGKPIEPLTGKSMLPALLGKSDKIHDPNEAIGYELSGNQALYKGDLKLIKNIPPIGDGEWHLYDIKTDPGETKDLQKEMPEVFSAMVTDYENYAKANGVLPMPKGYEPIKQVIINSIINVYIPRFRMTFIILGSLAILFIINKFRNKGKK